MHSKIIGKQNVFSHHSDTMSKALSLMILLLFFVATSFAPYVTSQQQAQAMASNNAEERSFSANNFEEEIHHAKVLSHIVAPTLLKEIPFPHHQILEPQHIILPAIKPPLA